MLFNIDSLADPGTVLIDDLDTDRNTRKSFLFTKPRDVISANSTAELHAALSAIDEFQSDGRFLAGYISYDAGLIMDKQIISRHEPSMPLLWLGVYDSVEEFDYAETVVQCGDDAVAIQDTRMDLSENEYLDAVERVKEYIRSGDVYQVNPSSKLSFRNIGTAAGLFARLRKAHPVCHSAFVNAGEFAVISLSPELFLRRDGEKIVTRPMKGTLRRGRDSDEDRRFHKFLRDDEKNRAENIMIVDLMRNDLGRICKFGSVTAPRLFHIERYNSLLQMTADVEGELLEGMKTSQILKATFPPGSITGAPKIRAIEVIDELESESRGVHYGSIGMFRPDGDFLLNVAIRTIVQRGDRCEMRVGGGIVADSDPRAELHEAILKGRFVMSEPMEFQLIETMLYRPTDGYALLHEHMTRLKRSAEYFQWSLPDRSIVRALEETAFELDSFHSTSEYRVRLLLPSDGIVKVEWTSIDTKTTCPVSLLLSARRTDRNDIFLYHKTTNRHRYDEDLHDARKAGHFDVLYCNEDGELTECAVTNLALEIEGCWYTPHLDCGLLPGTWRESLLARENLCERILTVADLQRATRMMAGNSVRGGVEVSRIEDEDGNVYRSFDH